jgi:hypothetical protein
MNAPNPCPLPSGKPEKGPASLSDPETEKAVPVADVRAEFERISRQAQRDPQAERAFIEGKIEMIRNDPNLSQAEKERAIEELRLVLR